MNAENYIIGIDLGTTNTVVAIIEGNEPIVIPNQEGTNRTPSVVAFLDNNECIVGEIARRQAATNPTRTISSVKRLIGQFYEDIEDDCPNLPYQIVSLEDKLLVDINGMGYTPEQVSALILKKMKESAEAYLGQEITDAVITVPANFNNYQRSATIEAAHLAGLNVLRLINEPTAAALAYGFGKPMDHEEIIAIYDFGGGTFDISLLEISNKTFEVLTSIGDTRLGGDDLDNSIVNLIVEEFKFKFQVDLTQDPVTLRRLKEVAEKAKCELSSASQTMITLPFIAYKDGHPLHLERQLGREEFEELVEDFIKGTIRCCKEAIDEANVKKNDIDKVILVGGSTRIPLVQDLVEDFFGLGPFKGINPDEVVAMGAATQAGIFSGSIEEVTLLDVAPHSLGIEVKDGKYSCIIDKNATIPIKAAKNFTTTEDDQTFVNIHILQGESEQANENQSLGKFALSDIPSESKGKPRVRVTFFVNADGVVEISAEELSSGISKTLTIVHSNLDENERKKRKRSRPRRRSTRRNNKSSRIKTGTAGTPTNLQGRHVDSSITPMSGTPAPVLTADNFAILSDTPQSVPGFDQIPPQPTSQKADLSDTDSQVDHEGATRLQKAGKQTPPDTNVFTEPKRYGATPTSSSPTAIPLPKPAKKPTQGALPTNIEPVQSSTPLPQQPPEAIPQQEANTMRFEETGELARFDADTSLPSINSIDWPGIVDSALDLANDGKQDVSAITTYQKALESLSRQTWLSDQRFEVLYIRMLFQIMAGHLEEFRETLKTLQHSIGDFQQNAIEELIEKAMLQFPLPADLRRDRAAFRINIGDLNGACEDLEFASKADPKENDTTDLEKLYKKRIEDDDDAAAKFKLVKIYLKSSRVDDAVEILQELQSQTNYRTRAIKILGLCHWQKNLHFLAWQKFKMLHQNEEVRDILYRLGTDMESTGQLNNALAVYDHIAEEDEEFRDVSAKVKKLRYRIKIQQEEAEGSKASAILSDPRFTIIEEINRGSMGIIFKAQDKTLEEEVALKVLNDYLCADPSAVERFKREARAAKKLSHPYIVRIHDLYESGNKRFISMEYIKGTDLKTILADGEGNAGIDEDQLIYYFLQLCDALSYAHNLNIIHRDIKPANVMITTDNNVKITDFGIAKILKSDDSTKSGTAVIGTPLYMAPEQITGEGVDARTDIYSLGIMMYELISGHPPFYLGNIEYHHIHTAPPQLPENISETLQNVIMRCVEKDPDKRFQCVDEIYKALQKYQSEH